MSLTWCELNSKQSHLIRLNLTGYVLCRRPPLSGRGLCGGGCVVLAEVPCWILVFRRFEFFGLTVKCVEAGSHLEVGCHSIFMCSCYFGHGYYYFGVQNLSFGRPGASISAPWGPFWQLQDTLGDHGSSRKDTWGPGTRFSLIWGWFGDPILTAFWCQMG